MSIGVIDMEGLRLGIDLGGTTVKVGLVDEELEIVDKVIYRSRPLDEMAACAEFSDQLKAFVVEARYDPAEIEGIGVAIPGTVLGAEVELLPNIQLDLQLLLESLRDYFPNADLAYLNDANAGALAEAAFGAGVGYRNVLYVTIGTGIGAGVVIGGKVIAGAHGAAGEIGHVSVAKGGRRCSCGRRGCLEQYASARGIVRTFREVGANAPSVYESLDHQQDHLAHMLMPKHDADSLTVFRAYEEGDFRAVKAVDVFAKSLGFALGQVCTVLDPDVVLLGGGVAGSAHVYLSKVQQVFSESVIEPCRETEILPGKLGNSANMLGAAYYSMIQ